MKIRLTHLVMGLLAVITLTLGVAAPAAQASAGHPASVPAVAGLSSYRAAPVTPLYDQESGKPAIPLVGQIFFELKNDFSECLSGEGAGNPVKTTTGTCSTFNIQYPNGDINCGPAAVLYISQNGYYLRARSSDAVVVLTNESHATAAADQNSVWEGSTNVPENCHFGGLANLEAANDAPNSSVYARNVAGDWRFILNQT